MKLLILFNSRLDPFGTHLSFSNSIAIAAKNQGCKPLIIDINRFPEEAYTAITTIQFDAIHLEQSHGSSLIKKAHQEKKTTPPYFSLVRDMPFYPWIKENIIETRGKSKFFYVEPAAIELARQVNRKHEGEYHPSLYTSSLLKENRLTKPSNRPIKNLYVGSYQDNNHYLHRIRNNKELSTALDIIIETKNTPPNTALCKAFERNINFSKEQEMVDICFLLNQVARSLRRERFLRKTAPRIPFTLVWNGKLPEGIKFHKDTKILKPKNYSQTVQLMHHSQVMWMVINNFGSALSERQLTAAAAGCIPFTTMNKSIEKHTALKAVFTSIEQEDIERTLDLSRDTNYLDKIHENIFHNNLLDEFDPSSYVKKIYNSL
ncbi:hypothetical protein [Billgrantia gudaonensis]|uniref:Glycosyl transferases group 1 n=1 Tax=Billgrantia gudaonensis TaxID=376427 RepID=A0A1G8SZ40_9GAMM|nr:hypothetical protein [Halomonas gudaonensis]SDJ34542.1 hypothetical protein SAMN04487954_104146 [Halomonas gudaonensis]